MPARPTTAAIEQFVGALVSGRRRLDRGQRQRLSTTQAEKAFLFEYSQRGIVLRAATPAGVSRSTVYGWRNADPDFADAMRVPGKSFGVSFINQLTAPDCPEAQADY